MVPILSLVLLISVSLLVQSAPQLAGRSAPRHAKEEAAWAIEVLTFSPSERKFVWAGLINKSDEPLLVCILDKGVSLSDKDGTLMGLTSGGSPHACVEDEQFHLLRVGQATFTRVSFPNTLSGEISGNIRVEVGLVARPVVGGESQRKPTAVVWEGTLRDAADLGRSLRGAVKGRK